MQTITQGISPKSYINLIVIDWDCLSIHYDIDGGEPRTRLFAIEEHGGHEE